MKVVKIFSDGETQLVPLPKDFKFKSSEVVIKQIDGGLLIVPVGATLAGILESLDMFTDDFFSEYDSK